MNQRCECCTGMATCMRVSLPCTVTTLQPTIMAAMTQRYKGIHTRHKRHRSATASLYLLCTMMTGLLNRCGWYALRHSKVQCIGCWPNAYQHYMVSPLLPALLLQPPPLFHCQCMWQGWVTPAPGTCCQQPARGNTHAAMQTEHGRTTAQTGASRNQVTLKCPALLQSPAVYSHWMVTWFEPKPSASCTHRLLHVPHYVLSAPVHYLTCSPAVSASLPSSSSDSSTLYAT